VRLDARNQTQRCYVPQFGSGAECNQTVGNLPLAVSHRVFQRRAVADRASRRLDVGARLYQNLEHLDIVAARNPVERVSA
jgi:hypothetical protein